jgi:hypothetical protein
MMKKSSSLIVIAILVLLAGVSIYLYKNNKTVSTLDKDARNFKIDDTSSITKIFMADKNGGKVTLDRKDANTWIVNGKFPARKDAISLLLYTMKMLDVKSPVSKSAKKSVLQLMTTHSVKVEVYSGDELIKQYYVGHENQEMDGTYMLLTDIESGENFPDPFLVFIPGFNGYLSSRYFLKEEEWRERLLISYTPLDLKSIKMELMESQDSSFVINLNSTTSFALQKLNGQSLPFDEVKMKQYLAYFQNLSYEFLLGDNNGKKLRDSLLNVPAFTRLSITDKKGQMRTFDFLHKKSTAEINNKYGKNYVYDPDRLYLRFDDNKEVALIQFYVFGKILQNYGYFLPSNSVKK